MRDFEALLKRRRAERKSEWDKVDGAWQASEKRRTEMGLDTDRKADILIRLNMGGVPVDMWPHTLASVP